MIANIGDRVEFRVLRFAPAAHCRAGRDGSRSTAGYAIGYLGGGVLLVMNLLWILTPASSACRQRDGIKLSFVSVGVWWLVFSIPLLRRVPEPAHAEG